MILKLSLLTILLNITLLATSVVVSKEAIKLDEQIVATKLRVQNISNVNKSCEPITLKEIQTEVYVATHYINKNTIICKKDIKKFQDETIVFSFGGLEIEKKGKIIYENSEFIRFKNLDGTIEQIYKDGRLK
ncbi:putative flagellar P ring chaperone FlgA [Aliarcobacter faecis]|uniref:hypothetical protein n=1 Tax=Aliarcobacter faecis TaxID=1564138 RepID=UPI00047DA44F|nr:hypothetical protein [Aliarcobacter faecis]QKF72591.1 putative flagellar P ring chaperone FlgA [Aliarcobacter faecis]